MPLISLTHYPRQQPAMNYCNGIMYAQVIDDWCMYLKKLNTTYISKMQNIHYIIQGYFNNAQNSFLSQFNV